MNDQKARETARRRLLFAVTDSRSMGAALAGMTVLLVYSLALGERTAVVYPWTARPLAVEAPDFGTEYDVQTVESVAASLPESGFPAERSDAREMAAPADPTATRLSDPDDGAELRGQELNALLAAETAEMARREAMAREVALAEQRRLEAAAIEAARAMDEAAALAELRSATDEATSTVVTPDPTSDASRALEESSSPDVSVVTDALTDAGVALERDDFDGASTAVDRAQVALAGIRDALGADSRELLTGRITEFRTEIAVRRLEYDIGDLIAKARVSQEAGDYPSAITVLLRLEARATEGSSSQRQQLQALLDLFRVTETIQELREACQFEIDFLGRTEPCEAR